MQKIRPGARVVYIPRKPIGKKIRAKQGVVKQIDRTQQKALVWYGSRKKPKSTKLQDLIPLVNY